MNIVDTITQFADQLTDSLSPAPTGDAAAGELFHLFRQPSTVGFDDHRLLGTLVELTRVLNLATTALAGAIDAAGRAGVPARKRLRSTADLLTELGHPPAVASRLIRVGAAAADLPDLTRQARTGGVSVEHADAVGRGVAFVAKRVALTDETRADLARRLSVQATPRDVDLRARELALQWAPDVDDADPDAIPVAENTDLNEMTLTTGPDGRTAATIDLDALTGEELNQALDARCRPVPLPDGSRDPRSAPQRRADAFGQVIRTYLANRDRPTTAGGVLPHATLIVPTRAASGDDESSVASLGFTGPVSPPTVGLVLCEAAVRRVVLDGDSAPLDVGREHRLVTVAIRKALEARDRGCAFPGCGRPVAWTDAHHCTPWSEGGDTSVDNCVLLCRMHHTLIHHSGWKVFIGHDRHPWFVQPADPEHPNRVREPIRSNARRTLTIEPTAAA